MAETEVAKTQWEMDYYISEEVSFRTGLDNNHGIQLSRFSQPVKLAEFNQAPGRPNRQRGLVSVVCGSNANLFLVPKEGVVNAASRLTLDYADETGPVPLLDGYFSGGKIVAINTLAENLTQIQDLLVHPLCDNVHGKLLQIYSTLLQDELKSPQAYDKIRDSIRNSNLPYHYIDAVKCML